MFMLRLEAPSAGIITSLVPIGLPGYLGECCSAVSRWVYPSLSDHMGVNTMKIYRVYLGQGYHWKGCQDSHAIVITNASLFSSRIAQAGDSRSPQPVRCDSQDWYKYQLVRKAAPHMILNLVHAVHTAPIWSWAPGSWTKGRSFTMSALFILSIRHFLPITNFS